MSIILSLSCIAFLLSGCSELNLNSSPVKPLEGGDYIYHFKYSKGCIGDAIKNCAKKELEILNLVPDECANGIEVLSGGKSENGWAHATFRCK
jgi:hypothetical protein